MNFVDFVEIAYDLEHAGLLWQPEIGDEVSQKVKPITISILVDPQGLTPSELRSRYLWLPSVEQLVLQFEARKAILFHAGLELSPQSYCYKTVVKAPQGQLQSLGPDLRTSLALCLRDLLLGSEAAVH
jgi:hypothetical protein